MIHTRLDHLVITAATLAAGVAFVQEHLGVTPRPGGQHPRMGTHNCLLSLGPDAYLEVIAVDPGAPAPAGARWFRLDRLGAQPPRLTTWVARTDAIERAAAAVPHLGAVQPMERGTLRWSITLPGGGDLPFDGIAPSLIQWHTEAPSGRLADSGCRLLGLEGRHPQADRIAELLPSLGFEDPRVTLRGTGGAPTLVARIQTPDGIRSLG